MIKVNEGQQPNQNKSDQLEQLIQKHQKIANLIALRNIDRMINKDPKVKIDITRSQYKLLKTISLNTFGWKIWSRQDQKDEANVIWVDHYVSQDLVRKLKPYQKINHFPNSYILGRKDYLAQSLRALKMVLPEHYNFYPKTWVFPGDSVRFQKFQKQNQNALFIIKPPAGCQGRGIYISHDIHPEDAGFNSTWTNSFGMNYGAGNNGNNSTVVQQYLSRPLLLDGFKFDLRLYVLVKSLQPLKIFIYSEGLARLATHQYKEPCSQNLSDLFMHLTNYAINKNSPQYVQNKHESMDYIGHKRTYSSVMQRIKQLGCDVISLQNQIDQLVVKTILAAHQKLLEAYRVSRQLRYQYTSVCFEIYGFDIMITQDFRPWLIEVNHSPSFTASSPLDTIIKKYLLLDTLNLLNVDNNHKIQYLKRPAQQNEERIVFPRTINVKRLLSDQNTHQNQHIGGFRRIYPIDTNCKYIRSSFLKQIKMFPQAQSAQGIQERIYKQIFAKITQKQHHAIQIDQKFRKTLNFSFKSKNLQRNGHSRGNEKASFASYVNNTSLQRSLASGKNFKSTNMQHNKQQLKFKSEQDYINFTFYNLFANNNILNQQEEYETILAEDKSNKFPMKMNNVNISFFGHLNKKKLKQLKKRSISQDVKEEKPKANPQLWFKERIYQTQLRSRISKMKVARVRLQKVHKQQRSIEKQSLYMPTDFRRVNG